MKSVKSKKNRTEVNNMYFEKIEKELNKTISVISNNLVNAIDSKEWEAVILSCGAIMDLVKSTQPQAFGNLAKVLAGKDNATDFFQ